MTTIYIVGFGTGSFTPKSTVTAKIECWGAGGAGDTTGDGGAGAGYSRLNSLSLTANTPVAFSLGVPGTTSGANGGDTWFSSAGTVLADGGGSNTNPVGSFTRAGTGGTLLGTGDGASGGTGAASQQGPGHAGGSSTVTDRDGGGGGGGNGGGHDGFTGHDMVTGGNGGDAYYGSGAVGTTGNGAGGGQGAGGAGGGATTGGAGGVGGDDYDYGGGGGGGGANSTPAGNGGMGGTPGGGGGGCLTGASIGTGGYALIKITYPSFVDKDQVFVVASSTTAFNIQIPGNWLTTCVAEVWGGGGNGGNGDVTGSGGSGASGGYASKNALSITPGFANPGSLAATVGGATAASFCTSSGTVNANGGGSGGVGPSGTAGSVGAAGTGDTVHNGAAGRAGGTVTFNGPGGSAAGTLVAAGVQGTASSTSSTGAAGGSANTGGAGGTGTTTNGNLGVSDSRGGGGGAGGGISTTSANGGAGGWPGGGGGGAGTDTSLAASGGAGASGLIVLTGPLIVLNTSWQPELVNPVRDLPRQTLGAPKLKINIPTIFEDQAYALAFVNAPTTFTTFPTPTLKAGVPSRTTITERRVYDTLPAQSPPIKFSPNLLNWQEDIENIIRRNATPNRPLIDQYGFTWAEKPAPGEFGAVFGQWLDSIQNPIRVSLRPPIQANDLYAFTWAERPAPLEFTFTFGWQEGIENPTRYTLNQNRNLYNQIAAYAGVEVPAQGEFLSSFSQWQEAIQNPIRFNLNKLQTQLNYTYGYTWAESPAPGEFVKTLSSWQEDLQNINRRDANPNKPLIDQYGFTWAERPAVGEFLVSRISAWQPSEFLFRNNYFKKQPDDGSANPGSGLGNPPIYVSYEDESFAISEFVSIYPTSFVWFQPSITTSEFPIGYDAVTRINYFKKPQDDSFTHNPFTFPPIPPIFVSYESSLITINEFATFYPTTNVHFPPATVVQQTLATFEYNFVPPKKIKTDIQIGSVFFPFPAAVFFTNYFFDTDLVKRVSYSKLQPDDGFTQIPGVPTGEFQVVYESAYQPVDAAPKLKPPFSLDLSVPFLQAQFAKTPANWLEAYDRANRVVYNKIQPDDGFAKNPFFPVSGTLFPFFLPEPQAVKRINYTKIQSDDMFQQPIGIGPSEFLVSRISAWQPSEAARMLKKPFSIDIAPPYLSLQIVTVATPLAVGLSSQLVFTQRIYYDAFVRPFFVTARTPSTLASGEDVAKTKQVYTKKQPDDGFAQPIGVSPGEFLTVFSASWYNSDYLFRNRYFKLQPDDGFYQPLGIPTGQFLPTFVSYYQPSEAAKKLAKPFSLDLSPAFGRQQAAFVLPSNFFDSYPPSLRVIYAKRQFDNSFTQPIGVPAGQFGTPFMVGVSESPVVINTWQVYDQTVGISGITAVPPVQTPKALFDALEARRLNKYTQIQFDYTFTMPPAIITTATQPTLTSYESSLVLIREFTPTYPTAFTFPPPPAAAATPIFAVGHYDTAIRINYFKRPLDYSFAQPIGIAPSEFLASFVSSWTGQWEPRKVPQPNRLAYDLVVAAPPRTITPVTFFDAEGPARTRINYGKRQPDDGFYQPIGTATSQFLFSSVASWTGQWEPRKVPQPNRLAFDTTVTSNYFVAIPFTPTLLFAGYDVVTKNIYAKKQFDNSFARVTLPPPTATPSLLFAGHDVVVKVVYAKKQFDYSFAAIPQTIVPPPAFFPQDLTPSDERFKRVLFTKQYLDYGGFVAPAPPQPVPTNVFALIHNQMLEFYTPDDIFSGVYKQIYLEVGAPAIDFSPEMIFQRPDGSQFTVPAFVGNITFATPKGVFQAGTYIVYNVAIDKFYYPGVWRVFSKLDGVGAYFYVRQP